MGWLEIIESFQLKNNLIKLLMLLVLCQGRVEVQYLHKEKSSHFTMEEESNKKIGILEGC
jgi:uncharacterized protein YlaI